MVPAIVVHCIKEVERKGPSEIGVYRVPGSEKDVKALKVRQKLLEKLTNQDY
jgi:Rac GTPase-activating protein 1